MVLWKHASTNAMIPGRRKRREKKISTPRTNGANATRDRVRMRPLTYSVMLFKDERVAVLLSRSWNISALRMNV